METRTKNTVREKWLAENADRVRAYKKKYRDSHRRVLSSKNKKWQQENREKMNGYALTYRNKNLDLIRERSRRYRKNHLAEFNLYRKSKYRVDLEFRLETILRSRLKTALRGRYKSGSAISLLGCSIIELKSHLESLFLPGMSWKNYGYRGWHIDHKKSLSSVDLTDIEQLKVVLHYSNLQPLWMMDNLIKH